MPLIEVNSLERVTDFLRKDTLVAFDLDNTLVESASQFGSYQWGSYLLRELMERGLDFSRALETLVPRWEKAQEFIDLVPVEPLSPVWLEDWRKKGYLCLGLTGRSPGVEEVTVKQLHENNIIFSPPVFTADPLKEYGKRVSYREGVIFAGPFQCKGEILKKICASREGIDHVILIDDQLSYLEKAESVFKTLSQDFTGIHFLRLREKVSGFDPKVAQRKEERLIRRIKKAQYS